MSWWPFVLRSTFDRQRLIVTTIAAENYELKRLLAETHIELHKHKMLLAGRSGVIKKMVVS